MTPETVIDIFRHALFLVMMGVSAIVIPGLIVGLIIATFQAATQINEMTLNFLPKLFVILCVIAFLSPWLINMITTYTQELVMEIPYLIG